MGYEFDRILTLEDESGDEYQTVTCREDGELHYTGKLTGLYKGTAPCEKYPNCEGCKVTREKPLWTLGDTTERKGKPRPFGFNSTARGPDEVNL